MEDIKVILENIKVFPKKAGNTISLFDIAESDKKVKKEYIPDLSDNSKGFIEIIKEAASKNKFLFLSYDFEATGIHEGWTDPPNIILCSFAIFGLDGYRTELFYNMRSIHYIDIYVSTSIKEMESIFRAILDIQNIIIVGWNISGYDHLLIEKRISVELSKSLIKLLYKKRLYDGLVLSKLLSIATTGSLDQKFSLAYEAKNLLGLEMEKEIRKEFIGGTLEDLREEHILYSAKDSVIAGFVIFRLFQKSPKIEEEVFEEVTKLDSLDLAKKSGFLTHNIQYLSNFSLTKVGLNGHEVNLELINKLCKELEFKIGNYVGCLQTGKLYFAVKKTDHEKLYVFEKGIFLGLNNKDEYEDGDDCFLDFGKYSFVNDRNNWILSENQVLKYVGKKYFNVNIVSKKEANDAKEQTIDVYTEENESVSVEELKNLKDQPNLQEDFWLIKFNIKSIEEMMGHDIILFLWFSIEKFRKQISFIKSYIPHYAKLNKKYHALNEEISDTVAKKKERMRIEQLYSCWGIDLNKEKSGRLYPSFQFLMTSGRTGCNLPNIQQVEKDQRIRDIFIAAPGKMLIISDYAAIEMCTESEIFLRRYKHSKLMEVINKGVDVHFYTGMLFRFPSKRMELVEILEDQAILNISLNKGNVEENYRAIEDKYKVKFNFRTVGSDSSKSILTDIFTKFLGITKAEVKNIRQAAKPINFGIPGGMKPPTIKHRALVDYGVAITEEESVNAYSFFLSLYPEVKQWLNDSKNYIKKEDSPFLSKNYISGCVTLTGRLRKIADTNEGHNEWHNTQFQGLAADGAKVALYRLCEHPEMKVNNMIHDEIITEVDEKHTQRLAKEVRDIMIGTMEEFVPNSKLDIAQEISKCWKK